MELLFGFFIAVVPIVLVILTIVVLFRGRGERIEGKDQEMQDKITELEKRVNALEDNDKKE